MLKAKKSLLITLFAAMMMFAFGAVSAFAAETVEWADDYSSVTVKGTTGAPAEYTYKTTREFKTDGTVAVAIDPADPASDVSWTLPTCTTTYYDLNKATFAKGSAAIKALYTNGAYTQGDADGLLFSAPDYVTNKSTATPVPVAFTTLNATDWTGTVKGDEDYDKNLATEQSFALTLDVTYKTFTGTPLNFYGVVPAKTVKVLAREANAHDVQFYKDEIKKDNAVKDSSNQDVFGDSEKTVDVEFPYDAVAHKVLANEVAGLPVAYEVFNKSTGKYDAVTECPTVTNVGDTAIVKATVSWTETVVVGDTTTIKTNKKTNTFNLSVVPNAKQPFFGFDKDGNLGNFLYGIEGSEYDAYSYIQAKARETDADTLKAAVAADQETLIAYFKDYYEVTTEVTKANPDVVKMAMKAKDLSADEIKALEKKYEALMKNYGVAAGSKLPVATTEANGSKATLNTNGNGLIIPEIEFVDSPTAVTYKAKKLKKKEASFTVTAIASNGQAVTYKLINAPAKIKIDKTSGTITLAKGLKKGKYKVTVKAFIPMGFDGKNNAFTVPSETHDILIKVKK